MKIVVCISKTPDTTAKIAFTDNNTKFAEAGVQFILNPYYERYGLVRAIELKEADRFEYPTQDGICQVQKPETIMQAKKMLDKYMQTQQLAAITGILSYKKQIILQGPPGTGKTRLAKEIAQMLTTADTNTTLTKEVIIQLCTHPVSIPTAKTNLQFKILGINGNGVRVQNSEGNEYTAPFNEIIKMFDNDTWKKEGVIVNGTHSYSAAVARYIQSQWSGFSKSEGTEYCKIIQFHPSYSYEDFIRGIVAKPNPDGEGILYEAENKTLAAFARQALNNFLDSEKEISEISADVKLHEYFDQFIEQIIDTLEENEDEKIALTKNVSIIEVGKDAFRYRGNEGWVGKGNRIYFKDILQAFKDGNKVRQDVKKNANLPGLARQHSSYFVRILNLFQNFLKEHNLNLKEQAISSKVELKNYVLIIDEINRANLSAVLGELIYALEYRGEAVESIYDVDGNTLTIPPNLYIIGTMNTADRSVGHIDYAIRRRFAFVEVAPQALQDNEEIYFNTEAYTKVAALFTPTNVSSEFEPKDVQIGHSYFIAKKKEATDDTKKRDIFRLKMDYEIIPILNEYAKHRLLLPRTSRQRKK